MGIFGVILLLIVLGATIIAFYQLKKMAQRYQLKLRNGGSSKQGVQYAEKQNLLKMQSSFLNQTKSMLESSHMDSKFSSKGFSQTYSVMRLLKCLLLVELSNCHTIHQMARGDYAYPMDMFNRMVVYQILILQIVSTISIGLMVMSGIDIAGFIIASILMTISFMLINYCCRYIHLYYRNRKKRINAGLFNASLTGSQTNFYAEQQSPLPQQVKGDFDVSHNAIEIQQQNEPNLVRQMEQGQKMNYLKLYRILFFLFAQIFFSVICINQLFWTQEKYIENTFFFLFILIIVDFFLIRPILIGLIVWFKLIWIGCFRKQLITGILEKRFREMKMEEEMLDYRKKNNKFKKLGKMAAWLGKKGLDQLNEEEEEESILKDELNLEEEERYEYKKDQDELQTELENAVDNECMLIEDEIQKLKRKGKLTEEEQKKLNELEQKLQKKRDEQQERLMGEIQQNMKEQMELQDEIYRLRSKKKLTEEEQKKLNELEQKLEQKQREEQQMVQQYKNEQLRQKIERENEIQKLKEKMKKEGLSDQEMKRLAWLEKQQILGAMNDNKLEQMKMQQEIEMLRLKKKRGKLTQEEQDRLNELEQELKQKQRQEQELKGKLEQKEQEIKRHDIQMMKKQKLQEQKELEDEIQRLRNKGDLTEEEQRRLNELEQRLAQNKKELRQLDVMEAEQKKQEYQMKQDMLTKRLNQNMKDQMELQDEIKKLKKKKNLTEEEQKRLNELEQKLEQKQKEQKVIQDMLKLLEQQKETEVMRVKNRKEIEQLEDEISKLRNKKDLSEQEQKKLNELEQKLAQKYELEQQLIAKQKEQEQKMREMEEKLESEDQKKKFKNRKKELEKEQERIREQQRIVKNRIKELELEEIALQEEIQRLKNKGDLTEEEQRRLNELEQRLKEVQKEKMQCQQKLQLLYQQQQENQREQDYLKKWNSRIDEVSEEDSDQEDESEDNDSYERYQQYQYDCQQDFEMSDEGSFQDQNAYLENNSNEHSLQTQNSNDVTQFNKQSKTLLRSLIQLNDSKNMTIDQGNKTNILEQEELQQDSAKDDLSQSQIKTNFNKELKFNMSLSMDQNSIINPMEHDAKDQQLGSEQENQSDSQIVQLNKIFQNNDKGNSKSNSLNTRNISFSSKANLQGLDKNQNYLSQQKDPRKSDNGFGKKVRKQKTKGNKGENQILVKTSTQMDIRKKGVEYSLDQDLYDNYQKLDFNEIEKMFEKKKGKKKMGHSNSQMKMGKKFRYINEGKFGEQMQKKYQEKSQMMSMIYNDDSRNISQQSIVKKPLKKLKTFKKEKVLKKPNIKQSIDQEDAHNFDYDAFLREQGKFDALQIKKDQIKIRQPPKTVEKQKTKKKKKKEKKVMPPPKISNGKSPYQEYLPKLIDKQVKEQKIKEKEQKVNLNKLMMSKNNDMSMIANQQKINKVTSIYQNQNSVMFDGNKSILVNQSNYGLSTNKKGKDNNLFKEDLLSSIKKQNAQIAQED